MMSGSQVQYRAGGGLANSTITLLFLSIPMSLLMMGADWGLFSVAKRVFAGEMITEQEWMLKEGLVGLAALGSVLLFLTTVVVYCCWKYRAYKNLKALGAQDLKYSPGWAVGYYFIPFFNLVRPAQVMSEIWRASGPEVRSDGPVAWKTLKPTHLITGWWAAWISSSVLSRISMQTMDSTSLDTLALSTYVGLASSAISIIGALYLISLIKGITRRQDALAGGMAPVASPLAENPSQSVPAIPDATVAYPPTANAEGVAPHIPQPSQEYVQAGK